MDHKETLKPLHHNKFPCGMAKKSLDIIHINNSGFNSIKIKLINYKIK